MGEKGHTSTTFPVHSLLIGARRQLRSIVLSCCLMDSLMPPHCLGVGVRVMVGGEGQHLSRDEGEGELN